MDTRGKSLILVKVGEMNLETPEVQFQSGRRRNFEKSKSNSVRKAEE